MIAITIGLLLATTSNDDGQRNMAHRDRSRHAYSYPNKRHVGITQNTAFWQAYFWTFFLEAFQIFPVFSDIPTGTSQENTLRSDWAQNDLNLKVTFQDYPLRSHASSCDSALPIQMTWGEVGKGEGEGWIGAEEMKTQIRRLKSKTSSCDADPDQEFKPQEKNKILSP